mgnify:CR=1 FL=1|jgi:hypothetical protein
MAKIVIAGDAVVVTSAMKLEDIKTIEKYRPKELVLKGGEDGKEPIFGVGTTHGAGNINAVGASVPRPVTMTSWRASPCSSTVLPAM